MSRHELLRAYFGALEAAIALTKAEADTDTVHVDCPCRHCRALAGWQRLSRWQRLKAKWWCEEGRAMADRYVVWAGTILDQGGRVLYDAEALRGFSNRAKARLAQLHSADPGLDAAQAQSLLEAEGLLVRQT